MKSADWYRAFCAKGPDYPASYRSINEVETTLMKAAMGAGVPEGVARELASLAPKLMSDPQLLALSVPAIDRLHEPVRIDGTNEHVVLDAPGIVMAAPVISDHLVSGAARVIVHDLDHPKLLWPVLVRIEEVFGLRLSVERSDETLLVSQVKTSEIAPIGPPQLVPEEIMDKLGDLAARRYVPASEESRQVGAGAGLDDND